ncbi:MAG: lysylphosphatidylglycerol synthase domain-containing protein [Rubrobacteraceae bacterium]
MMVRMLGVARRFVGPALIVVVAVFLGRALYGSFSEARDYEWRFDPVYLSLSVALIFLYYLQQWGGWRLIMRSFGDPLPRSESAIIWYSSILGRYVPGSVAMVAGRIGMCRRHGIPAATTFASLVYENALILISSLLLAAASVPFWPPFPYERYALLLTLLAPICLVFLHPAIFGRLANAGLRRFKREPLKATLPFGRVLLLLPYYVGGWLILGFSFSALAASIAPVGAGELALLIGGYAFAWEIGFLALVTPSGLGVKEGVLYVILRLVFPAPISAALVVLSRLWQTLAELACAAAVWVFARTRGFLKSRKNQA